jgi:hypothetical protein
MSLEISIMGRKFGFRHIIKLSERTSLTLTLKVVVRVVVPG